MSNYTLASRRQQLQEYIARVEQAIERMSEEIRPFQGQAWERIKTMSEEWVRELEVKIAKATSADLAEIRLLQGEAEAFRKILSLPITIENNMSAQRDELSKARLDLERLG